MKRSCIKKLKSKPIRKLAHVIVLESIYFQIWNFCECARHNQRHVMPSSHVLFPDMFPRVLAEGKEVSVHPYSKAFLRCSVIYPSVLKRAPNPFWTKDNKGSLDPQTYKQDNFLPKEGPNSTRILYFQLTIFNVTLKDYGGYSCGATIKIGGSVIQLFQNLTIIKGKDQETFITVKQFILLNDVNSYFQFSLALILRPIWFLVSGGVTDKKDWLGTNENSPNTLSLIAAGSAAVGFAMGVIFVAYKMCQSRGYTWKSFFGKSITVSLHKGI